MSNPNPVIPLILSAPLRQQIEQEGEQGYPNEICGILIGRDLPDGKGGQQRVIERLEPGRNVFEKDEQYHRFSIDPAHQLRAEKAAEKRREAGARLLSQPPRSPGPAERI